MEKPRFELFGSYKAGCTEWAERVDEYFDSLEAAESFAEKNLDEYVIYMHMKIAEKTHEQCLPDNHK